MTVPEQARVFEDVAAQYERGRPDFPDELGAWLASEGLLGPDRVAVDLGAGTGKLTRQLAKTGARVIAVEPIATMREVLEQVLPSVESLDGIAEAIPVDTDFVDVVTAATAFHWFANQTALSEILRVLHDTGEYLIVTTDYERSTPLQQRLVDLRSVAQRTLTTTAGDRNWRAVIDADVRFEFRGETLFRHEIYLDWPSLLDRLRSNSAIAALSDADRAVMFEELSAMVDDPSRIDVSQRARVLRYGKA
jgi:ubiquinone/menaquinone biosynthesis C-methylase UbiE